MKQTVNQRIKEIRISLNLNQTEFAAKINLSQTAIWKIESGENKPSSKTLKEFQKAFNVNPEWLNTGKGDMYLSNPNEVSVDSNPWKEEAYKSLKEENSFLKKQTEWMQNLINNLSQKTGNPNFHKVTDVLRVA